MRYILNPESEGMLRYIYMLGKMVDSAMELGVPLYFKFNLDLIELCLQKGCESMRAWAVHLSKRNIISRLCPLP